MCSTITLVFSLALVVAFVAYGYVLLGFGIHLTFNDQNCQLVGGPGGANGEIVGSEDLVHYKDGVMFVTSGDLFNVFNGDPAIAGAIYAVDIKSNPPTYQKIPVVGYPSEIPFQPHGMFYSNATKRLFVVSHGFTKGGTRVVVFSVQDSGKDLKLKYLRSVVHPLFGFGTLNDVVEGATARELYVTNWLPLPLPEHGRKHPSGFGEKLKVLLGDAMMMYYRGTHVFRCEFDDSDGDSKPATCAIVASNFYGANGITKCAAALSPTEKDGSPLRFFVNDALAKRLHVFERAADGALQYSGALELPMAVDNIDCDANTGVISMGSIPIMYKALQKMTDPSAHCPGGLSTATPHANVRGEFVVNDSVVMHDGSKLSQISVAVPWRDRVVMGSPFSSGVLVCPLAA